MEQPAAYPTYEITLGTAYWGHGYFNVDRSHDRYLGEHGSRVEIELGDSKNQIFGRVDRNAQRNGTPRIVGNAPLKSWIQDNFEYGDQLMIEFLSPNTIRLRRAHSISHGRLIDLNLHNS
jgi:hypothetical protein